LYGGVVVVVGEGCSLSHCVVVVKKENGARARMPNNKTRRQGFAPHSSFLLLFRMRNKKNYTRPRSFTSATINKVMGSFFLTRKTLLSIVKENFPALETKF
jgi:hypothetical protein